MKMYVVTGKEAGRGWKYWKYDREKNIIYCPVSFKKNLFYFHETLLKHFVILAFLGV